MLWFPRQNYPNFPSSIIWDILSLCIYFQTLFHNCSKLSRSHYFFQLIFIFNGSQKRHIPTMSSKAAPAKKFAQSHVSLGRVKSKIGNTCSKTVNIKCANSRITTWTGLLPGVMESNREVCKLDIVFPVPQKPIIILTWDGIRQSSKR